MCLLHVSHRLALVLFYEDTQRDVWRLLGDLVLPHEVVPDCACWPDLPPTAVKLVKVHADVKQSRLIDVSSFLTLRHGLAILAPWLGNRAVVTLPEPVHFLLQVPPRDPYLKLGLLLGLELGNLSEVAWACSLDLGLLCVSVLYSWAVIFWAYLLSSDHRLCLS